MPFICFISKPYEKLCFNTVVLNMSKSVVTYYKVLVCMYVFMYEYVCMLCTDKYALILQNYEPTSIICYKIGKMCRICK